MSEVFSADEQRAIRSLDALAKRWPATLTLFSVSGSLVVMKTEDKRNGKYISSRTATITGIPNDGGDPDWEPER